ncbi:jg9117 [Pararge aegeria aegeria]|uniref:Jg9117 protein n=1 Tax=Pararge aegeria aegeria TaxID=348720 RepID=A0A8S4SGR6_9NEOP|nr:jg9117 [Pararge aegeria aegeria]
MGGAHSSADRWTLGPKVLESRPPTRSTNDIKRVAVVLLGAAVNKRPRILEFGTPCNKPMSSSGSQQVEVMMITRTI